MEMVIIIVMFVLDFFFSEIALAVDVFTGVVAAKNIK